VKRLIKPWLLNDWIFKATELGKKYYKAMQCEQGKIKDEIRRINNMRETADKKGRNCKKPSLMELLIQYGDINKEEIIGEITTLILAGTETTYTACGYVLALLGENQQILARVMQEQQDIFGDDILRPVTRDDLPRMVYLEQVSNCLLRSSLFGRIVAIFLSYIK
jgi:cytochrome P450